MSAAACQAGTSRRRPAGTFRHPGSDIGEPRGIPPPRPRPAAIARRQPRPPSPDHHRRRQRDCAGCRARRAPRRRRRAAGRAGGRARAPRSRALSLGGFGPGPVTRTAAPGRLARRCRGPGVNQAAAQSGWLHRPAARPALHRPAVVLEEPRAMRLGRLVPAAAYRMRRSGSEWSWSRRSLPAHGHESWPCRGHVPARLYQRLPADQNYGVSNWTSQWPDYRAAGPGPSLGDAASSW